LLLLEGRFRWERSNRKDKNFSEVIHKEHYERFIKFPAWQYFSISLDQEPSVFSALITEERLQGQIITLLCWLGLFKALH
jgi:hypothetical protein